MKAPFSIPQGERIEFVRAALVLEFREPFTFTEAVLPGLRGQLRRAARRAGLAPETFAALFDPPVSSDPYAQRRYQRPGPAFVLHPPAGLPRELAAGESLELPLLLLGRGARQLAALCRVWLALGELGLERGQGRFTLNAVLAEDLSGNRFPIWSLASAAPLPLVVTRADWWLDGLPSPERVRLTLHTPARLLANGRPLFRPGWENLFPFLLRRVGSMVHAHCEVELFDDPAPLFDAARRVEVLGSRLRWRDWRVLEDEEGEESRELGGVAGRLDLGGEGLAELLWLLRLASLLNLGKGASYGAGYLTVGEVL
ncbi:MAG: CRISPR system precrRNA processing endoribonuclease RAMP protein Cas6 [Trichloromonas sp.]|jgi:hypothetical protein|nr:CRISPR system precrRNA processing endoribonuclease RAMP protein Cas6 [Trichloromonas sp.]